MKSSKQHVEKRKQTYSKALLKKWIAEGKADEIKSDIEAKNPSDLIDSSGSSFLHVATKYNNLKMIKILIDMGCEVNTLNRAEETPLLICLAAQNFKAAEILLKADTDIFATNSKGQSALEIYFGFKIPSENVSKLLIQKVRSISTDDNQMVNIIREAGCQLVHVIHLRDPEVTKIYLDQCGPTQVLDGIVERTTLMSHDIENLKVLFFHGHVDDYMYRRGKLYNNLLNGCCEIDLPTLQLYMELTRDWKLLEQHTAVFVATLAEKKPLKTIRVILETGINEYLKREFQCDLLVHAFGNRDVEVIAWIIAQEFDIYSTSNKGQTTLHISTKNGVTEHVARLLNSGMDPNVTDETGKTPIFNAIDRFGNSSSRSQECVKLLLQHGADIQICDNSAKTFLENASLWYMTGYLDVFMVILKHLAKLKSQGIPIKAQIENYLSNYEINKFYKMYFEQLDQMKAHSVCESLTLFTILTKNMEAVCREVLRLDKKSLAKLVNDISYSEYDYYYISALKDRINDAVNINKWRKKASVYIRNNIEVLKAHDLVSHKIACYLPYDYLKKFEYLCVYGHKQGTNLSNIDSSRLNSKCIQCELYCKKM